MLYCQSIYDCWLVWIIYYTVGTHGRVNVVGSKNTNPLHNLFSNEIAFYGYYIIPLANRLENLSVFGWVINNSNTTSDRYSLTLASLARINCDCWMQERKKVPIIVVESTQSIIFPSVEIDYLAQELENNDELCCIDDNSTHCKIDKS